MYTGGTIRVVEVRQLPRGRHRLTREEVMASQRGRMLDAIAQAVADKGYARTSVADVISRAGVSRETFYQQFADKEDCFLAAFEASVEITQQSMTDALLGRPADPLARYDRAVRAYLDLLAREGAMARVFLIDVYAAGPRALRRRREVQARFVDLIADIFGAETPADRFACEALVAATSSMVTVRVAAGELDALPGLRAPLVSLARRLRITAGARRSRPVA
jgi:AcrR family transcriptional regulator